MDNLISHPKIKELIIDPKSTLIDGIKQMDNIRRKLLIAMKGNVFVGLLSIGDIQRAIIKNYSLSTLVSDIIRNDYIIANTDTSVEEIKKTMQLIRAEFMPVFSKKGELVNVYFWEDLFGEKVISPAKLFNLPVVIMAGGLGTRLKPLTNVLPKALIPLNEKTMIEEIMESFNKQGCKEFYISVNYKAELIEYYLRNQRIPYNFNFIKEEKPLGTAGSLYLLKEKIFNTFFVINCDIIINQDYYEILDFHKENNNDLTIVAALKHINIPYGTVETGDHGQLLDLKEKPEITFKINSGLYVMEPYIIDKIPVNQFYHITSLIDKLKKEGGRIGVFPVSEGSWKDIGEWSEYIKERFH